MLHSALKTFYILVRHHVKTNSFIVGCAVFTLLFFTSAQQLPVKLGPIVLHPQLLPIVPKEFFIAEVTDGRTEKSAVALIFSPPNPKQKPVAQAVDLKGGGQAAIQDYIFQSLPRDKKLRPIVVRIKECKVTESLAALGRVEGKVAVSLAFDLRDEVENIHLTDYCLDTKYNRPDNQQNFAQPALQESFSSALKYFNTWINSQAENNPKLAKSVKVFFKDYREKEEGDTIYYAVNRPLTWNDFQDKPPNSKYAAIVFPSFGFDEKREVVNGEIRLYLDMKVYVPKSACWVKDGNRVDYTLNHEQRHFDIVKIVAKRFEQKIRNAKLPVANCDGLINFEFYESFREMNSLQKQYDNETGHGTITTMQERWNNKIDQDLIALGIKYNS